jgi:hypothetical protein
MAATIQSDGTIRFRDNGNRLLSTEEITRGAIGLLQSSKDRHEQFEQWSRVAQLRRSCGIEPEPITIKRPEPYRG